MVIKSLMSCGVARYPVGENRKPVVCSSRNSTSCQLSRGDAAERLTVSP